MIYIQSTTIVIGISFLLIGEERQPVGGIAVDEDCLPDCELDDSEQRVEHVVHNLAQLVPPGFGRSFHRAIWVGCLFGMKGRSDQPRW